MSNLNNGGLTRVLNYIKTWVTGLLNSKANSSHTHTKSQITDFPTIPTKTSQLTNDSGFITSEIDSMGEGWIRFKSGLQICWGLGEYDDHQVVSYAKAFNSFPSIVTSMKANPINWHSEHFTMNEVSSGRNYVSWQAIGRWK